MNSRLNPHAPQNKIPSIPEWLISHGLTNPHSIPTPELQAEFNAAFPPINYNILWPQPGGQEQFGSCPTDICLYGGEAGSGKSWNLLFDHVKWIGDPNYIGTVVRKTYSQIFDAGGLWDEAKKLFTPLGGKGVVGNKPVFIFPSGAQIYFKHSQHEGQVENYWQGLQSTLISMDELTHFSKREFLYAMGRNRNSKCDVRPYMRMTCNPDPISWVREMIDWWIGEDGFVIPERSGVIRFFVHADDKFVFADTEAELREKFPEDMQKYIFPMTFTFIRGYLDENQKLMESDPGYRARLENQTEDMKMALSRGNWNVVHNPNALFQLANINDNRVNDAESFDVKYMERIVVGVDPAGGAKLENDETGIITAGKREIDGEMHAYLWVDDSGHYTPDEWSEKVCTTYHLNMADMVAAERNYGGDMVESTIRSADKNINVKMVHSSRGKWLRAEPVAALYARGLVHHVGHKMKVLENQMVTFEQGQSKSPNRLDAAVFALTELMLDTNARIPSITILGKSEE